NGCTKEEIKSILKEKGTVGAVFVGDLPSAWYYTNGCFGWSGNIEIFPTDLYYMDLNGVWGGEMNDYEEKPFSSHTGNIKPEIFVARLATPVESEEIDLLKMYFKKNHKFRNFGNNISNNSLSYIDNDWSYWAKDWGKQVGLAYQSSTVVNDMETTNGFDYKNRWRTGYEHLLVAVHSNYYQHFFDPSTENGRASWVEVKEEKPAVNFYNLFACSNALYTVENYMAGWYIFQDSDYGLTAVGSTKTGSMLFFDKFYESLSVNNFGIAFRDWLSGENVYSDKCWFGGMVMIGDPTLKSTATCTESHWKYTLSPKTCPSSGKQTKVWTKVGKCTGGVNHTNETIGCNYTGRDSACIKKKGTCKVWETSKIGALCNNGTGRIEANLCMSNPSTKYRCCVPIKK
nr:hypothetical protein [Candidatus Shapirobacteria bacterium]